ncbi:MAG TPA: sodium:solute symporter [Bacteroidales bacterium]|jgi:SSS family solute:Na+ symporter|nr:sodium:solute symporter [Bacteroidales bacterium]
MATLDWIVLGIFFLGLIGIIIWVIHQKDKDTTDYFLAGKNAGWVSIGSSIFASNIGSEHLVGLAGAGFVSGMAMAHWEIQAWLILLLGWVFVPFYDRIKIYTMPELLEKRFSPESRTILSVISLVSYVLTKVAVTVYAGGVVFDQVFNIESVVIFGREIDFFWVSAIGLVVITGLYTVLGGMKAVMYTSVLQTPVLLFGSIVILIVGLAKVGGWAEIENAMGDNLRLIRPASDPDFPWTGVLLGSAIIGFWYWCTDQFIVQRVLSGSNQKQSRRGTILAGYFKLLPVFIFLIPGMIAFTLNQKGLLAVSSSDSAFAAMVATLLPKGVTGIVVCGLLAALMSSLASLFNSSAMLFTEDFYKKMRPNQTPLHYLNVGRMATAAVVILGVLWIPVMLGLGKVLYEYLQGVQGMLAPAIASVFLLGVFWKRMTSKAAFWGMISGFTLGMFRLALNIIYGLGGKIGALVKSVLYIDTESARVENIQDLSSVADKIQKSFPPDIAASLIEKINQAKASLATLTMEGKTHASELIAQVKDGVHQHFLDTGGIFYKIASINIYEYTVLLFFFSIITMVLISLFTKAPTPEQLKYTYAAATPEDKKLTRESWNKWDVIHTIIILGIIVAFYIYFW